VLYPLLNHTQLKSDPHKRPQIKLVLRSLISNAHIRDVHATTTRLVERCLEEPRKLERSHSAENVTAGSASSFSLQSVAAALPDRLHPVHAGNAPYATKDPVRVSSLLDVSQSLAVDPAARRPRSATTSDNDRSGGTTPTRRRPPPVPPSKKLSVNSTGTWSGSEDGSAASSPALGRGEGMSGMYGSGFLNTMSPVSAGGAGFGQEELVKEGAKGVPPPIIEVHPAGPSPAVSPKPARPGWISFAG
jgi:hypothetical protein